VTISTFHGCPSDEIEAIARQCLDWGWHTVVKLNPTLLGFDRCRQMLDEMGYSDIEINRTDFEKDMQWSQLMEMVPRLRKHANDLNLGLGFKLTNTLVCRSDATPFFPGESGPAEMYLSGPPLHVLSYTLAAKLRAAIGASVPLTFSAGVDRENFTGCVAGGLGPVTSCSDLLKGRGYGRMTKYVRSLEKTMQAHGVGTIGALRQALVPGASSPDEAAAMHLAHVTRDLMADVRYHQESNQKAPKKVGTSLELLNCLTCDKCIPVCPNVANFEFPVPQGTYAAGLVRWGDGDIAIEPGPALEVQKRHQIGNVADLCNECGQCDPWCPEDGGPYIVKPTVFISASAFQTHTHLSGFHFDTGTNTLLWRRDDAEYSYRQRDDGDAVFRTPEGALVMSNDRPKSAEGTGEIDLIVPITMRLFAESWSDPEVVTWFSDEAAATTFVG
jgi:putative selenate reductase